jgi:hypothetical protein
MKDILILLAAMVGVVCGVELGAEIQGVTTGDSCTVTKELDLYTECVEDVAIDLGLYGGRRLEQQLRGDRELQSFCAGCPPGYYPAGHFCFVMCSGRRRLSDADERLLSSDSVAKGQIQKGANECLLQKIQDGVASCLGDPNDLRIKILLEA